MIQDIAPKVFHNEYFNKEVSEDSFVFIFDERTLLLKKDENTVLSVPQYKELLKKDENQALAERKSFQYIFSMDGNDYFLRKIFEKSSYRWELLQYQYEKMSTLRQMISKEICFAAMNAFQLYVWYRDNRFCGRCGRRTVHDTKQRMLFCTECRNMIFPKIAPAVIIGLVHHDKILMSKYADREYKKYALLAGFVEFGETAEETVVREVMEEVGLKVKHIKYYKSQPWGIDSNLLLGYFAMLDGEETISLDQEELAMAEWYSREEMPAHDDGISLTREMMGFFENQSAFETWYRAI